MTAILLGHCGCDPRDAGDGGWGAGKSSLGTPCLGKWKGEGMFILQSKTGGCPMSPELLRTLSKNSFKTDAPPEVDRKL